MEVTEASVLMLPFAASSAGEARRRLVSDLVAAGIYDSAVCDVAGIRVAWRIDAECVQVSVRDGGGETSPELGEPTQGATGGRGLRIVEKLSKSWGTSRDEQGTTVWAQVPVSRATAQISPVGAAARHGDLSRNLS